MQGDCRFMDWFCNAQQTMAGVFALIEPLLNISRKLSLTGIVFIARVLARLERVSPTS